MDEMHLGFVQGGREMHGQGEVQNHGKGVDRHRNQHIHNGRSASEKNEASCKYASKVASKGEPGREQDIQPEISPGAKE